MVRQELNDKDLDQVVGGTVIVNGTRMRIGFSYHQQAFDLVNCDKIDAMLTATQIYAEYRDKGDKAFEEAVMNEFRNRGWLGE